MKRKKLIVPFLIGLLILSSIVFIKHLTNRMNSYIEKNGKISMGAVVEQMQQTYELQTSGYYSRLTIYSSGTFFFTRSYEGKAILANIAIPAVLMCAVWYLQEKNSRNVWIILFVTAVSALTFSGSAIIFPIVIAAGMAPAAVMNKRFSGLVYCAVCMLPSALYAAVFFACRIGLLTLAAS